MSAGWSSETVQMVRIPLLPILRSEEELSSKLCKKYVYREMKKGSEIHYDIDG